MLDKLKWYFKVAVIKIKYRKLTFWSRDRVFLEFDIIRKIRSFKPSKVLFVGVASYTSFYEELFDFCEFHTIDNDGGNIKFGSGLHVHGSALQLEDFFTNHCFDVVVLNGVYGWGVNSFPSLLKVFKAIKSVVGENGRIVFGYNKMPGRDEIKFHEKYPAILDEVGFLLDHSFGWQGLEFKTSGHHTYYFFKNDTS